MLSFFSKVLEKTMYNHLIKFIDANKIVYKYQFRFRKSHSTNHAIILLAEKLSNAIISGKISIGVFFDLRKAFDTVDHCILLDKLHKYGIRGTPWNGFKSYLENRKQYVCYSDTLSATMPITHGVPQGSILGPLLFILYINDLANVSDNLFSIPFADDTIVLIEGTNINTMIATLNCELAKLTEWLNANKLSINVSKSHYIVFHRSRRKINKGNILLDTTILSQVTYTKFLGVILDDKLKWTHYISYIKHKISKGMGIIQKARKVLKKKVLLRLYHSFVTPYLIYCLDIWGNASDIHLQPLITTHKTIVRIITFFLSYCSHTNIIFKHLNVIPLKKKLLFLRIGLQMFKYEYGQMPESLNMFFFVKNRSVHNYNTRNKDKLRPAIAKHLYRDRDFRLAGVHVWNYICDNINIDTTIRFI